MLYNTVDKCSHFWHHVYLKILRETQRNTRRTRSLLQTGQMDAIQRFNNLYYVAYNVRKDWKQQGAIPRPWRRQAGRGDRGEIEGRSLPKGDALCQVRRKRDLRLPRRSGKLRHGAGYETCIICDGLGLRNACDGEKNIDGAPAEGRRSCGRSQTSAELFWRMIAACCGAVSVRHGTAWCFRRRRTLGGCSPCAFRRECALPGRAFQTFPFGSGWSRNANDDGASLSAASWPIP